MSKAIDTVNSGSKGTSLEIKTLIDVLREDTYLTEKIDYEQFLSEGIRPINTDINEDEVIKYMHFVSKHPNEVYDSKEDV